MDYNEIRRREAEYNKENGLLPSKKNPKKLVIICIIAVFAVFAAVASVILYNNSRETNNDIEVITTAPKEPAATLAPTMAPTPEPTLALSRRGTAQPIPEDVRAQMNGKSMPAGASISYDQLSYLTIPHYDFNYNVTTGHLVVNKALAEEVLDIFAELFDVKYPIERMELIDKYGADDWTSIDHNNTSAFCYRNSTAGSGKLSNHALGHAIDINPQINPYVSGNGTGQHQNAAEYWSRDTSKWTTEIAKAAYIGPGTEIYRIFVTEHGWTWGGSWASYRDYQHFEK